MSTHTQEDNLADADMGAGSSSVTAKTELEHPRMESGDDAGKVDYGAGLSADHQAHVNALIADGHEPVSISFGEPAPWLWTAVSMLWQVWFWCMLATVAIQMGVECYGQINTLGVPVDIGDGAVYHKTTCSSMNSGSDPHIDDTWMGDGACLDGDYTWRKGFSRTQVDTGSAQQVCNTPCANPNEFRVLRCAPYLRGSTLTQNVDVQIQQIRSNDSSVLANLNYTEWATLGGHTEEESFDVLLCSTALSSAPATNIFGWLKNATGQIELLNQSYFPLDWDAVQSRVNAEMGVFPTSETAMPCSTFIANTATFLPPDSSTQFNYVVTAQCVKRNTFSSDNMEACKGEGGSMASPCRVCKRSSMGTVTAGGLIFAGFVVVLHVILELITVMRYHNAPMAAIPVVGMTWGSKIKYHARMHFHNKLLWILTSALSFVSFIIVTAGNVELRDSARACLLVACISASIATIASLVRMDNEPRPTGDGQTHLKTSDSQRDLAKTKVRTEKLTNKSLKNKAGMVLAFVFLLLADYDIVGDLLFVVEIFKEDPKVALTTPATLTCEQANAEGYGPLCRAVGKEIELTRPSCSNTLLTGTTFFRIQSGFALDSFPAPDLIRLLPFTETCIGCNKDFDVPASFCTNVAAYQRSINTADCQQKKVKINVALVWTMRLLALLGFCWGVGAVLFAVFSDGIRNLPFYRLVLGFQGILHAVKYVEQPGIVAMLGEDLPQVFAAGLLALATGNTFALLSLVGSAFGLAKRGWGDRERFERWFIVSKAPKEAPRQQQDQEPGREMKQTQKPGQEQQQQQEEEEEQQQQEQEQERNEDQV